MATVAAAGVPLVAELNHGLPASSASPELPWDSVKIVSEVDRPPLVTVDARPSAAIRAVARRIAPLIPSGSALELGQGSLGSALYDELIRPVHLHTGVLMPGVIELAKRGLLASTPVSAYIVGTEQLYWWSEGRPIVTDVLTTHQPQSVDSRSLIAVNGGLEVDLTGQVNVEVSAGRMLAGVGGHADFSLAASRSIGGLSIVGLPAMFRGRSTLKKTITGPVSTPRMDIDIVVNDRGVIDLRGLSDAERGDALVRGWDGQVSEDECGTEPLTVASQ